MGGNLAQQLNESPANPAEHHTPAQGVVLELGGQRGEQWESQSHASGGYSAQGEKEEGHLSAALDEGCEKCSSPLDASGQVQAAENALQDQQQVIGAADGGGRGRCRPPPPVSCCRQQPEQADQAEQPAHPGGYRQGWDQDGIAVGVLLPVQQAVSGVQVGRDTPHSSTYSLALRLLS